VVGVPPQNPIDRAIVDVPTLGVNLHPTRSLSERLSPYNVGRERTLRALREAKADAALDSHMSSRRQRT
jgi:hypothetical protein